MHDLPETKNQERTNGFLRFSQKAHVEELIDLAHHHTIYFNANMSDRPDMFKELGKIRNLPTLPAVINKLRNAVLDINVDALRVARIIEDDPSMMAKVMRIVNSAFYGTVEPITSVQQAVARMGMNAVHNIALSTTVFSVFGTDTEDTFDREAFWRHCIATGVAAGNIYDRAGNNAGRRYGKDVLHLAGLVHDIGKIVFDQFFHDAFVRALTLAREKKTSLYAVEAEVLGADHAAVGAWLAERWRLSEDLIAAIRWHHTPNAADDAHRGIAQLCHLANELCNAEGIGHSGDTARNATTSELWAAWGMGPDDRTAIIEATHEEARNSEIMLSLT